jgi:hypothetical protein
MQEKRNIRLIISLLVLVVATSLALCLLNRNSDDVDQNLFKVADLKSIDHITLESAHGNVDLKFDDVRWMINSKYQADRNLIDVLFATLQQIEPKRPVAATMHDSISNALEKSGVKISLFADNKKIKTFFAGGNKHKSQAYFKTEGNGTPYITVIPGYRIYTSGIFELDENGWRDKRIFNFNWQNFKSLTTTFPAALNQNFKVSFIDRYFGVEGVAVADTTKLNNYLDAVSLLVADQFIQKGYSRQYDSAFALPPAMIIDVMDAADRHFKLSLYPINKKEAVPGIVGEDQYLVLSQRKFREIFRKKDYFKKTD